MSYKIYKCERPKRVKDITGQKFNMWTVLRYYGKKIYDNHTSYAQLWEAQCECGDIYTVEQQSIKNGLSKGCIECRVGVMGNVFHPLHSTWKGMKGRCGNPNHADYKYYGERGIRVCMRWQLSFDDFLADVGERPEGKTLDRIDTNGDYGPGNVRWATHSEQMINRRLWKRNK